MVSIRIELVHTYYKHAYGNGLTRCKVPELNSAVTAKLSQELWQVSFQHATMYHCKRAWILYVPANRPLQTCTAAGPIRMRWSQYTRLLHMKHDVTSKGAPQWNLGKRGPQYEAKPWKKTACPRVCLCGLLAKNRRGQTRALLRLYIHSCLTPDFVHACVSREEPQQKTKTRTIIAASLSTRACL
jgi:hypothetical protein